MSEATRPEVGLAAWLRPGERERAERLADLLSASGIRHLRLGVSWADHHRPDGNAWYGWLLPRLAQVAELLPCVHYTPPSLGQVPDTAAPPREPRAYADFLDAFVDRHGHLFEWIELWNEPNNLNDWDWRLDPGWAIFGEMIVRAAYWMKQRGKRTVLAGTSPTDADLLEDLRVAGVLGDIDALSVHAFPGTWTPHWQGWGAELAQVEEVARRCPRPPQVWITEAGYSTWRHDEMRQLAAFAEAARAPAERMYWYSFDDLHP
jgi:CDP-paratose 2-epimerase